MHIALPLSKLSVGAMIRWECRPDRYQGLKLVYIGRLYQMMIKTGFPGLPEVLRLAISAESDQQDFFRLRQLAQTPRHLISIYAGQPDVKENDLRFEYLRCLDAGKTVN